jgi:hypothetical protein
MDSDERDWCSHQSGFPIRISPDHSLLAASRSFSQLIASFIAYLRLGIHTHALSSLTIKSTSHIRKMRITSPEYTHERYFFALTYLCFGNWLPPSPQSYPGQGWPGCRFVMPVKYSIVKDLDCLSNRLNLPVQPTADFSGGPRWNRTTDLTLIRGAL